MGKEEGMVTRTENEGMGCVGGEWEEEGWGERTEKDNGDRQTSNKKSVFGVSGCYKRPKISFFFLRFNFPLNICASLW